MPGHGHLHYINLSRNDFGIRKRKKCLQREVANLGKEVVRDKRCMSIQLGLLCPTNINYDLQRQIHVQHRLLLITDWVDLLTTK